MPKTLDADARNRRYLATMAVRVACFLGGAFAPLPWNLVLFACAAILPAVAVILANAVDLRTAPGPSDDAPAGAPALTAGVVVDGDVDGDERGATGGGR